MSAITDKWLKAVPLYTDTLAGAISNATVTTFQVTNGSTDLENGEVYEVTIDRVTAQGVSTGRREVVIAQYTSATKTFDCSSADYRGIEGTAQAHPVGAVVEILVTAHYLNEHRAAFLVGHTQAGAHASALPLTSPVLTTPKVVTSINDANGNEVIKTPATGSAVNEITVTNAATNGSPLISATGGDTNINLKLDGKGTGLVIPRMAVPEGYMLNGKIVPSVSSNNLTVALKTLAGTDPSAADPIYVRIGDTVRTITAALTFTLNAGTNFFNAGSAELATKEIDYFVFLVFVASNSTIGLGITRRPGETLFTGRTNTTEGYMHYSGTLPADTDTIAYIGRFAATLSAGAGYTWTVPTFTATNLIQRPINETRWLTFTPTVKGSGGTVGSFAITFLSASKYMFVGNTMYLRVLGYNISNVGSWSGGVLVVPPMLAVAEEYVPIAGTWGTVSIFGTVKALPFTMSTGQIGFYVLGTGQLQWTSVATGDSFELCGPISI